MTTSTLSPSTPVDAPARPARSVAPIPTARLVGVELRKMFDTRAGFWMMASVGTDDTVLYVGEVTYRGDFVRFEMDLQP